MRDPRRRQRDYKRRNLTGVDEYEVNYGRKIFKTGIGSKERFKMNYYWNL